MNCEQTRTLLEEFFDAELEPSLAAQLAAHLGACHACAAAHESLAREQEFYLSAAPAPALAPDFWTGVVERTHMSAQTKTSAAPHTTNADRHTKTDARAGMDTRAGAVRAPQRDAGLRERLRGRVVNALGVPRFSPALTAAAVLLAVGLTALVMNYLDPRHAPAPANVVRVEETAGAPPQASPHATREVVKTGVEAGADEQGQRPQRPSETVANVAGPVAPPATAGPKHSTPPALVASRVRPRVESSARREPTADELVREAEHKYVAAIALLSRDVRRRRPALDAAQAASFERTLAAVDRTINEARRAARRQPDDPQAAQYMLAAYARKVDLLRELANQ